MITVTHSLYSLSLALSAFFPLFLHVKTFLKGKHFANVEQVKQTTEALKSIKSDKSSKTF